MVRSRIPPATASLLFEFFLPLISAPYKGPSQLKVITLLHAALFSKELRICNGILNPMTNSAINNWYNCICYQGAEALRLNS